MVKVNKGFENKASDGSGQGGQQPTERMRELVIRNIATEMGVRGALAEPFEAWKVRVEILQSGRDQGIPISPWTPLQQDFLIRA